MIEEDILIEFHVMVLEELLGQAIDLVPETHPLINEIMSPSIKSSRRDGHFGILAEFLY